MCSLTKEVQRFFKYIKHQSRRERENTIQPLWRAVSPKIINADRSLYTAILYTVIILQIYSYLQKYC